MEETLPPFGMSFANPSFSKQDIPNLPKLWHFLTFHISLFVNTTAMVVSYGMKLGPVDLSSDVLPWYRHLVAKNCTISGQLVISSAFQSG